MGKSTGEFSQATAEYFAQDAAASLAWLKQRERIKPSAIGFPGHSEGGYIAPLATLHADADAAFMIFLAGLALAAGCHDSTNR